MPISLQKIQKIAYTLASIVFAVLILSYGDFIFVPLLWGTFFAFLIHPITDWLENKRIPRAVAIWVTIVVMSAMVFLVFYLLINQVVQLIFEVPNLKAAFQEKVSRYLADFSEIFGISTESASGGQLLTLERINSGLFETGKSLVLIGIIPLYVFLLLYYKDFFIEFLKRISGSRFDAIQFWVNDSGEVIKSYIVGMIFVTFIVSCMAGLLFYSIGVKFYLLFAVFIAVMNLIPYVGVLISSFLVVFYVLLTTDSVFYPVFVLFMLWVMQGIENNIITPFVVGTKVKVNALAVVLAILAGGALWGVSGMILFIPLIGVLKISLDRIPALAPYGYLLGDNVPVLERRENFWKIILRKLNNIQKPPKPTS
jgi:predicted PurR-regulated permease PerM